MDELPLRLNPHARLRLQRQAGQVSAVSLWLPRRAPTVLTSSDDPELFAQLVALVQADAAMVLELSDAQCQRLCDLGLLIGDAAVLYSCPIDGAARALPPAGAVSPAGSSAADEAPLLVHPGFWGPAEAPVAVPACFATPPAFWITEPVSALSCPYWATPSLASHLGVLAAGQPAPDTLPAGVRDVLTAAGVLDTAAGFSRACARARAAVTAATVAFAREHHAVLPGVFPPLVLAALQRYAERLTPTLPVAEEPQGVPQRRVAHNDPLWRWFHQQLAPLVATVVGEPLKPSYVFFSAYLPGAGLLPHTDREACEWTLSVLIDYLPTPAPDGPAPWPIFLRLRPALGPQGAEVPRAIGLGLGDGVLFAGREIEHWREPLPDERATLVLFHFVPQHYRGSLD